MPAPDLSIETKPAIQIPRSVIVNSTIGGFYEALPVHYKEVIKPYPLLIFISGAGQFGDGKLDLPLLLNDGPAQLFDEKKFPPNFKVNGSNYSFIVLSPQFRIYPTDNDVADFINYALQNYQVDRSRIYLAGLSVGGLITSDFSAENASLIAAAVPISGVLITGDVAKRCKNIADGKLPMWVFHNINDPVVNSADTRNFVAMINNDAPTIPAKLTLFDAAVHDAWTKAINPAYKENNLNIYEWMLQYTR